MELERARPEGRFFHTSGDTACTSERARGQLTSVSSDVVGALSSPHGDNSLSLFCSVAVNFHLFQLLIAKKRMHNYQKKKHHR